MVRIIEGYDHVSSSALLGDKAWVFTPSSRTGESSTLTFVTGRINGRAARHSVPGGGSGTYGTGTLKKALPSSYATVVVGFAFRLDALPASETEIFQIIAGGTAAVRIFVTSTGAVRVKNSGGTTLATGTATFAANAWVFIEIKAFENGASGTIETKVNGASDIASTTVNIGSTAFDQIGHVYFPVSGSYTPVFDFDDTYALDTGTGDNTTFLGDCHVETVRPAADGANTAFTPNSGSAHYSCVNENSGTYPNGDTSYVSSQNVGDRDTYDMDSLSVLAGTIFAVQNNLYARKDDAATREIASVVRQGGSNYDGTSQALATSYAFKSQIYENDPSDSADWTVTKVNSAEFGVKVTA